MALDNDKKVDRESIKKIAGLDPAFAYDNDNMFSVEGFLKPKENEIYAAPKFYGMEDFDFVDSGSSENLLNGRSNKWCVRVNGKMYFSDLIQEMKNNSKSSYGTCFTKEEFLEDNIPEYFSVILKQPQDKEFRDSEVFASRILNYFGVPVVYNRAINKSFAKRGSEYFLMSVDFLRKNERFIKLCDIMNYPELKDIKRLSVYGTKNVVDGIVSTLEKTLSFLNIDVNKKEMDALKRDLVYSILVRYVLLADSDYRNGNSGFLYNVNTKSIRSAPNFDMEEIFNGGFVSSRGIGEERFKELEIICNEYPEIYCDFITKLASILKKDKKGVSKLQKLAYSAYENKDFAEWVIESFENCASKIKNNTNEILQKQSEESGSGLE